MIAKAIDKIVKMTEPHIVFVRDGRLEYSDKELAGTGVKVIG